MSTNKVKCNHAALTPPLSQNTSTSNHIEQYRELLYHTELGCVDLWLPISGGIGKTCGISAAPFLGECDHGHVQSNDYNQGIVIVSDQLDPYS